MRVLEVYEFSSDFDNSGSAQEDCLMSFSDVNACLLDIGPWCSGFELESSTLRSWYSFHSLRRKAFAEKRSYLLITCLEC